MALVMRISNQKSTHIQYQPFSIIQSTDREQNEHVKQEAMNQLHLERDAIGDIYPCTALQEDMMFLSLANPGTYICHQLYSISPEVTDEKLQLAWRQTTKANSIRRTRIFQAGSRLYQAVLKADHVVWDKSDDMDDYALTNLQRQVDMGGQLVRVVIVKAKSDQTRIWIVSLHHSVADGFTIQQLLGQTAAAYKGQTLSPRHFSPFLKYVVDNDNDGTKEYWRSEFAGLDLHAAAFPALSLANYTPKVEASLTYPILHPSDKRTRHTLTSVICLAMANVLARVTESTDVVIGVTTSRRSASLPGIDAITGPTVASYPMRIRLHPSQKVDSALADIQAKSIRVLPFEHYGLQNIQKVSSEAARACQFQTYVNIWPVSESEAPWPFTLFQDGYSGHAAFGGYALQMDCVVKPQNKGVTIIANYDPQTISHEQLSTLFSNIEQVLRQIWSDNSISVGQLHVEDSKTGIKERLFASLGRGNDPVSYDSEVTAEAENQYDDGNESLPLTEAAIILRDAIASVLNISVDSLKMQDNFFRIGGDSIAAMQVSARCRLQGLLLTVADIFQKKIIAKIAENMVLTPKNQPPLQNEERINTLFALSPM
ncbi:Nonribosomal peptide synthetase 6-like protein [Cladobotryum mycophilum]|uniref:Nonribosomal peptide synthetase 6-like protein n=1 Tax=Cladobotryum mycophilum TaxID=491253 RepID=A0ABR0SI34_9HYPO